MASVKPNFNKEGQIISYRFRACVGRNEVTGKQDFATKTVPAPEGLTPAKALKKMQADAEQWETNIRNGKAPAKKSTFGYFIENEFIPVHVCNGKHSPATCSFYKDICGKLVEYFGKKPLTAIRSIDIDRYLVELMTQPRKDKHGKEVTYSASYVGHFRTVLAVAFGFAERHGMVEVNPMRRVNPISSGRKEVDFLTEDEAKRFLLCLNENAPLQWKVIMNMLIRLGLRRGELCGLKWQDIDFKNMRVAVCRNIINNSETDRKNVVKDTKTSDSTRILPLSADMARMLLEWKRVQVEDFGTDLMPGAFVFGKNDNPYEPKRPDNVTQWLRRFNNRHGLRNVSPHDLRHTCATLLLSHNATVKETQMIMGHADASTTLKFYAGVSPEMLRNAADKLSDALAVNE